MGNKKKIIFLTALLALAVTSTGANSIVKRETNPDYFNDAVNQLSTQVEKLPLVGKMFGRMMSRIQNMIRNLDALTDGNLSAGFNSLMPCRFRYGILRCEGEFDTDSARKVVKKLFEQLPYSSLPSPISTIIRIAADTI